MYCPRCSTEFQDGSPETYCRGCGLEIAPVTALVTGNDTTSSPRSSGPNQRLMRFGIGLFVLGLVIALFNAALSSVLGFAQIYGTTIFLLMVGSGLGLLGLGMVVPRKQKRTLPGTLTDDQKSINTPANTNHLPPPREEHFPVASVTEQTTRNLR